jgi:hypothetical protein
MLKAALGYFVALVLAVFGFGALVLTGVIQLNNPVEKQETIVPWNGEDGYAKVGDTSTWRLPTEWLGEYLENEGYTVVDHGTWWQASKSGYPTVSWGEWGKKTNLGDVEGVVLNKALFVAMRDYNKWTRDSRVSHFTCVGTFIPAYASNMSDWDVSNSTVIQFDGNSDQIKSLIEKFASEWAAEREAVNGCVAP